MILYKKSNTHSVSFQNGWKQMTLQQLLLSSEKQNNTKVKLFVTECQLLHTLRPTSIVTESFWTISNKTLLYPTPSLSDDTLFWAEQLTKLFIILASQIWNMEVVTGRSPMNWVVFITDQLPRTLLAIVHSTSGEGSPYATQVKAMDSCGSVWINQSVTKTIAPSVSI